MVLPGTEATPQVEQLVSALDGAMGRKELQEILGLSDRTNFLKNYIRPAMEAGVIEYTIPEKPNSSRQKYRLTKAGKSHKETLNT